MSYMRKLTKRVVWGPTEWCWDLIAYSAITPFVWMAFGLFFGLALHPLAAIPFAWVGGRMLGERTLHRDETS